MFLSAQGLLSDAELRLSPFLLLIEQWIRKVSENMKCGNNLEILDHTQFLDRNINYPMHAGSRNKRGITFCTYLLKVRDFKILKTNPGLRNNFDLVVLEETHALDSSKITDFVASFENMKTVKGRNSKVWITSNAEKLDLHLPGYTVSPRSHVKLDNLRNTSAVAKLAESIDAFIGPERYPSTALPIPSVKCHIAVTWEFEFDDEKRLKKVVKEAKMWKQWLPESSVLLIDCEHSDLNEMLKAEGICFKMYPDKYEINETLFLKSLDPVEAIVAGAEWHVLIIHITANTMSSVKMIKLFNKRIISRATMKVIIFSDRNLDMSEINIANFGSKEKVDTKVELRDSISNDNLERTYEMANQQTLNRLPGTGKNTPHPNTSGNLRTSFFTVTKTSSFENRTIVGLTENLKKLHSKITASGKRYTHYEGYDFTQMTHLDDSLRSNDIYLVSGQEKVFIVKLKSDIFANDQIVQAQKFLESTWKVQVPAYCDGTAGRLFPHCKTQDFTPILKLLHLLKPKISTSKDKSSEPTSDSTEETDQFTENGKLLRFLEPKTSASKDKSSEPISDSAEETDQFTKNGKLLHLLKPKTPASKNKSSEPMSDSAEETDQFTKNGKLFCYSNCM